MKKKLLSVALALCMIMALLPTSALASESGDGAEEDRVSMIIELEDEPTLSENAESNRTALLAAQNAVQAEILDSIDPSATFSYAYSDTFNGFQADVRERDISLIEALSGVKAVYPDAGYAAPQVQLLSNTPTTGNNVTGELCNVAEAWGLGYKGKGTVVAVIGTGIDADHPYMVLSDNETAALKKDTVAAKLSQLNASEYASALNADTAYASAKIPFQFDYADRDSDATAPTNHPSGVHAAGVIAANGTAAAQAVDGYRFDGVAPEAQIVGMKVTKDSDGTAEQSDILAAMEDAITLGVDVICLTLGSPAGYDDAEQALAYDTIFARARSAGILISCSAGDSGAMGKQSFVNLAAGLDMPVANNPDYGLLNDHATQSSTTAVASCEGATRIMPFIRLEDGNNTNICYLDATHNASNQGLPGFVATLAGDEVKTYDYVMCGFGEVENFGADAENPKPLTGKIAVIERGQVTFAEKVKNAQNVGAIGVIVYNNKSSPEEYVAMSIDADASSITIPAIYVLRADGEKLHDATTNKLTIFAGFAATESANSNSGQMSEFSARGATPDLSLKPELTAPGGDIWSTLPEGKCGTLSSTDSAAAFAAGAMALMQQKTRATDAGGAQEAENLLMSTAVAMNNPDAQLYSPKAQGAGIMNLSAALSADCYLVNEASGKAKIELGDKLEDTVTLRFSIVNTSQTTAHTYALGGTVFTEAPFEIVPNNPDDPNNPNGLYGVNIGSSFLLDDLCTMRYENTLINGTDTKPQITVGANSRQDISVTLSLDADTINTFKSMFTNGLYIEGFVTLTETDQPTLSIPYMGFYGDWNAVPVFDGFMDYDDAYSDFFYPSSQFMSHVFNDDGSVEPDDTYRLGYGPKDERGSRKSSYDWISFSPNSDTFKDDIFAKFALLRNVTALSYEIRTQKGDPVRALAAAEDADLRKTHYNADADFVTYKQSTAWDGKDGDGKLCPDGVYQYVFIGKVDYPGATAQERIVNIRLDTTKPDVTASSYDSAAKKLTVTLHDEGYIVNVTLLDANGNELAKDDDITPMQSVQKTYENVVAGCKLVAEDLAGNTLEVALTADYLKPSPGPSSGDSGYSYYTIMATAEGNGSISPSGSTSVREGRNATYTITPSEGYEIADVLVDGVSVGAVTTYTFEKLSKRHTISAAFKEIAKAPWVNPFKDVAEGNWFYSAVEYAGENGLFEGVSTDTFAPNAPMTRQMLWTVLGRLDGQALSGPGVFDAAKAWATGKDVTDGSDPDRDITREQLITILWRYAGSPKANGNLSAFSDADSVASYARDAMAWAVENGLVQGADGKLLPKSSATRAQVAAILMRYAQGLTK